jgi:tetratricopeptide (TPR) repeat protein
VARWARALGPVPIKVLAVPEGEEIGLRQLHALRDFWSAQNHLRPALVATRWLYEKRQTTLGRGHPATLLELAALGSLLQRSGDEAGGAERLEQAWTLLRSAAAGRDLRLAVAAQTLAGWRVRQGQREEAAYALEIAYRIRKEANPQSTGLVAAQLGELRVAAGRTAEALPLLAEALERTVAQEGTSSPRTATRAQMLGTVLNQLGRHKEAVLALRPAHETLKSTPEPERRAAVAFELGYALHHEGVREEGLRVVEEAIRLTRQLGTEGAAHPTLATRLTLLARLQVERGRPEEAEGLMMEALDLERRMHGDHSLAVAERYAALGGFCVRFGRTDEALGWLDAACSLLASTAGVQDPRTRSAVETQLGLLADLAEAAAQRRDRGLAADLVGRATEIGGPVLGHAHAAMRRIRELRDKHHLGG